MRRYQILIKENLVWYGFMLWKSNLYNWFVQKNFKSSKPRLTSSFNEKPIKRIALIYSKSHFDPEAESSGKKLGYSASNLARNIYNILREQSSEVYYFDQARVPENPPQVDLIVGILSNGYIRYAKACPEARHILFLVNAHPIFRLKALIKESRLLHKIFPLSEFVDPTVFSKAMLYTDKYILIGNDCVKKTYTEDGYIADKDISLINSGVNTHFLYPDEKLRPLNKLRVLYVGSHLGIRKGLFRVIEMWNKLNKDETNKNSFELYILGRTDAFTNEINSFVKQNENVKMCGWIESNTQEYLKILQSSHVVLGPSIEEGQVGAILEAMTCGAVPIITPQCGIDIINEKEGFLVDVTETDKVVQILKRMSLHKDELHEMSRSVTQLIQTKHTWENFAREFKKALNS